MLWLGFENYFLNIVLRLPNVSNLCKINNSKIDEMVFVVMKKDAVEFENGSWAQECDIGLLKILWAKINITWAYIIVGLHVMLNLFKIYNNLLYIKIYNNNNLGSTYRTVTFNISSFE